MGRSSMFLVMRRVGANTYRRASAHGTLAKAREVRDERCRTSIDGAFEVWERRGRRTLVIDEAPEPVIAQLDLGCAHVNHGVEAELTPEILLAACDEAEREIVASWHEDEELGVSGALVRQLYRVEDAKVAFEFLWPLSDPPEYGGRYEIAHGLVGTVFIDRAGGDEQDPFIEVIAYVDVAQIRARFGSA